MPSKSNGCCCRLGDLAVWRAFKLRVDLLAAGPRRSVCTLTILIVIVILVMFRLLMMAIMMILLMLCFWNERLPDLPRSTQGHAGLFEPLP